MGPSLSNCLLWALKQKWRYGGRILRVPSEHYWGPHFQWEAGAGHPACKAGEVYERNPIDHSRYWCPPILHRGVIERVK